MHLKNNPEREFQLNHRGHWDTEAKRITTAYPLRGYYHRYLNHIYKLVVPPGRKVLEIGCGDGNLLASVKPSFGGGIDFSAQMLQLASALHPDLHFLQADDHVIPI